MNSTASSSSPSIGVSHPLAATLDHVPKSMVKCVAHCFGGSPTVCSTSSRLKTSLFWRAFMVIVTQSPGRRDTHNYTLHPTPGVGLGENLMCAFARRG